MPETLRLFAAVTPSVEAIAHLEEFLAVRREAAAYRWTRPEQWHLTLAFLDRVPERRLDDLVERLGRAGARRTPFPLRLAGGGAFPNPGRAKVLWVGLDADETARTELDRLATGARAAAGRAGAPVEGGRFRPHLTLARINAPTEVSNWVRLLDGYRGPAWSVGSFSLIASYLGQGPRGRPRYEVLAELRLGPSADA